MTIRKLNFLKIIIIVTLLIPILIISLILINILWKAIYGTVVPDFLFIIAYTLVNGLPATLLLTALGLLFGFILGLILAIMRIYGEIELQWIASGYEKLFRGIPLIVLIFIFAFGMPGIFWYLDPIQRTGASVVLALALRSAAYQSQIFRGAILSVNPGQMDAALSLGMSRYLSFRYIIFPQALRLAVPSWSNEYAVVIKDSSFAYAVGIIEMTRVAGRVSANYPVIWAPTMGILAILYFLVTYPVTKFIGEKQSKKLKDLGMGGG